MQPGKKLIFWNVAGLTNKDKDFWDYINETDFVSLAVTWVEEREEKLLKKHLNRNFIWKIIRAKRNHKKRQSERRFYNRN